MTITAGSRWAHRTLKPGRAEGEQLPNEFTVTSVDIGTVAVVQDFAADRSPSVWDRDDFVKMFEPLNPP
jgi:hypothetical protein